MQIDFYMHIYVFDQKVDPWEMWFAMQVVYVMVGPYYEQR